MKPSRLLTRQSFAATALLCAALTATAQVPSRQAQESAPAREDAQALVHQGLRLADAGHHAGAVEAYNHALRLAPNDAAIYNNLGGSYARLKRYEEAFAALERAVALQPDFAVAHYNLGEVYGITGRDAAALAEYGRALTLDPKYNKAHVKMCQTYLALERDNEAVACYETLLKRAPQDAETRANYGYALFRTKQHKKAVATLEEAVHKSPGRLHFVRVRLEWSGGKWRATPTGSQGSHIQSSLVDCDGVARFGADASVLNEGDEVMIEVWKLPAQ